MSEGEKDSIPEVEYKKYLDITQTFMIKIPKDTQEKLGTSVLEKMGFELENEKELPEPEIQIVEQKYDLNKILRIFDLIKKIQRADEKFRVGEITLGLGKDQPLKITVEAEDWEGKPVKSLVFWIAPEVEMR